MAISFELGERVLIPAYSELAAPKPGGPSRRPLWIYASDPASFGLRQPVVRIEVPYEELKPGPEGALFKVSCGALPPDLIELLDWDADKAHKFANEPLDLENRLMLVQGGLLPTTGDPRFAGQMVYAVCQETWRTFARALGRNPTWGPWVLRRREADQPMQLLIKPFSMKEANAFYDRNEGSISFGYFQAWPTSSEYVLPEGLIFAALSRDVIAHEVTHALLDGMRAEFMRDTHPDVRAFHEAFADIVALLHNFSQQDLVQQALEDTGGLNADALLSIGRQIGEATNGSAGGAMRRALSSGEERDKPVPDGRRYVEDLRQEEHERGSILVAAIFEAFVAAYETRAKPLFRLARGGDVARGGVLPAELTHLLAREVHKLADQFLNICIRAIDYCPPVDVRFGEYLRAMLTADFDVMPDDGHGYREKLIKSFRRRNIKIEHVRDLSQESLRWRGPDEPPTPINGLRFRDLTFEDDSLRHAGETEIRRRAEVLGTFITRDPDALWRYGLRKPGGEYGPIVMQSVRLLYRVDAGGFGRNDLIAEVTQTRTGNGSEFVGGATLIVGSDGGLRYTVRKRVDDIKRRKRELAYAGPGGAQPLDLRQLHRLPPRPPPPSSR